MKIIEKPNTKRLCPRCRGKFEFDIEKDLKFSGGGRRRIAFWNVSCPFCHYKLFAWEKEYEYCD